MNAKVVSQNYGRERYVAKREQVCRDICTFNHNIVNIFSPVCTSGLSKLKPHLLDHIIENNLRFWSVFALHALLCKQFKISIKAE